VREPALRELQGAFWRALATRPGGAKEAAPDLSALVRSTGRLSASERLDIYASMYFWRIVEALGEDFPKVAAVLGAEIFADLVRDYVAAHPSTEPSIRHVGRALPAFLGGRTPEYLGDLARLEWVRLDVFDSPDAVPLTLDELRAVSAADWPDLRFALVPACARLVLDWPVHRLWADPEAKLVAERTALRVWREDFVVSQCVMDSRETEALERVAAGEPFSLVCEAFANPVDAGEQLLRWIEDGIIARRGRDPDEGPLA
jgi:hypothetical protein